MRFLLITIILQSTLYASLIYAQGSTQIDWQEFYPLHTNDFWKYIEDEFKVVTTKKVIDSELMPNGKEYGKILVKNHSTGFESFEFQRVDSLGDVYGYNAFDSTEVLLYKLDVEVGDTWQAWFDENAFWRVEEKTEVIAFGKIEGTLLAFDLKNSLVAQFVVLIEGLGETQRLFEGGGSISLKGAVINGIAYGDTSKTTHVDAFEPRNVPEKFFLEHAYPNPFAVSTQIYYKLKRRSQIKLSIFNVKGELVKTILNQTQEGGEHYVNWDGRNTNGDFAATGLYFAVLRVGRHLTAKKIILKR